jgi:hypothetical protein
MRYSRAALDGGGLARLPTTVGSPVGRSWRESLWMFVLVGLVGLAGLAPSVKAETIGGLPRRRTAADGCGRQGD